ncbi:hypothetical protein ABK040_007286 [Willaertia magna]
MLNNNNNALEMDQNTFNDYYKFLEESGMPEEDIIQLLASDLSQQQQQLNYNDNNTVMPAQEIPMIGNVVNNQMMMPSIINNVLNTQQQQQQNLQLKQQQEIKIFHEEHHYPIIELDYKDNVIEIPILYPKHWSLIDNFIKIPLDKNCEEFLKIEKRMNETIRNHSSKNNLFTKYEIKSIYRIEQRRLYHKLYFLAQEWREEQKEINEVHLFHGCSAQLENEIIKKGLDPKKSKIENMFGVGVYFACDSSKSNQYAKCEKHNSSTCFECEKKMFVCRVLLGESYIATKSLRNITEPPEGKDSVIAPSEEFDGVKSETRFREYIVYNSDQIYPEYVITYKLIK